jgi:peptidyl-tRNA hydrolase, PTH1 family
MKLIVGLGNPGKEYLNTRHNAGFLFLDYFLASKNKGNVNWNLDKIFNAEIIKSADLIALRPQNFMNNSGEIVKKYMSKNSIQIEELILVYDDLDIKLGSYKICKTKSPKKHNGVNSVIDALGSSEFTHVRVGVEAREGHLKNIPGMEYVLMKFTNSEMELLNETYQNIVEELLKMGV